MYKAIHNDNIFLSRVDIADTFLKRLKGLMFEEKLDKLHGLIIYPCNSIHMFFMNFPIDVLFVDKNDVVVGMRKNIKPWQISKIYFSAEYVLEMSSGIIDDRNICIGDKLHFEKEGK